MFNTFKTYLILLRCQCHWGKRCACLQPPPGLFSLAGKRVQASSFQGCPLQDPAVQHHPYQGREHGPPLCYDSYERLGNNVFFPFNVSVSVRWTPMWLSYTHNMSLEEIAQKKSWNVSQEGTLATTQRPNTQPPLQAASKMALYWCDKKVQQSISRKPNLGIWHLNTILGIQKIDQPDDGRCVLEINKKVATYVLLSWGRSHHPKQPQRSSWGQFFLKAWFQHLKNVGSNKTAQISSFNFELWFDPNKSQ